MFQKILGIIKPFLPLVVTAGVIVLCAAAPALADIPALKAVPDKGELDALLQEIEDAKAAQQEEADTEPSAQPKKSRDTDTDPVVAETVAAGVGDYEDGVYTGSGTGYGGTISVQVTVEDAQITDITILSASGETDSFLKKAKNIIQNIITAQTWDVDAISGATYSSSGIKAAVKNALTGEVTVSTLGSTQNSGNAAALTQVAYEEPSGYVDGVYTGSAQGFGGMVTVEVTIADGTITGIQIVSAPGETSAYLSLAASVTGTMLSAQSPNVDTVSGATYSSSGIINAVKNALASAKAEDSEEEQQQEQEEDPAFPDVPVIDTTVAAPEDPDTPEDSDQKGLVTTETTTETYSGSSVVSPDEDEDFDPYSITVTVTVSVTVKTTVDGTAKTVETTRKVTGVTVSGATGSNATFTSRALTGMQAGLISSGTADTVARATCSSAGIRAAYAAAISGVSLGTTTETFEVEETTDPEDTEEPSDPAEPADPAESADQAQPSDTEEPSDPDDADDADDEKASDTDQPADPAEPAKAEATTEAVETPQQKG